MKIAVIGCGVMGSAFARGFASQGHEVFLSNRTAAKGKALADEIGGTYCKDLGETASKAELVLIAVKPKDFAALAIELGLLEGKIVVSIMTGATVAMLEEAFPGATTVRTMPNLALSVGESVIALVESEGISGEVRESLEELFRPMGMTIWTGEDKIDAITALAGSGPAFVLLFLEAMVEGGIAMGLHAKDAQLLAAQTMRGAVALAEGGTHGHPGAIRWQISSPGGTTIAGLKALEDHGVRKGIINALIETYLKSKKMI